MEESTETTKIVSGLGGILSVSAVTMAAKKKKKKKKEEEVALVEKIVSDLFGLLGITSVPKVSEDKDNDAILVNIETVDEAGLLIGNRGETLNSIQSIVGMIYRQLTGEWRRILVNIADWRQKQEERLTQLAYQTAERAKTSGQPQPLYNLTASQRRVVHLALAEDSEVETNSAGEGRERYLVVSPAKSEKKQKKR